MNITTILIQSCQQPDSDNALTRLFGLHKEHEASQGSVMWLGVENEAGQIYRLIGVEGIAEYVAMLKRLDAAGYWVQSIEADVSSALHAIVRAPGDVQSP